jgi:hypothetical protein
VWWGGVATIAAVGHLQKGAALHAKGKGKDVLPCSFKHACVHWIHGLALCKLGPVWLHEVKV